jgi:DNA-binding response OmpR family regulator
MKVLIVEDDKFLRELLVRKLKTEGLEVSVAIEGKEALKKIREEFPQLVLLDLVLPGIDGFEVLRRIKEDPATSKVPVIILSNLGQREEVEKGIQLGANDYLVKAHFTPEEIVKKVKGVLGEVSP